MITSIFCRPSFFWVKKTRKYYSPENTVYVMHNFDKLNFIAVHVSKLIQIVEFSFKDVTEILYPIMFEL